MPWTRTRSFTLTTPLIGIRGAEPEKERGPRRSGALSTTEPKRQLRLLALLAVLDGLRRAVDVVRRGRRLPLAAARLRREGERLQDFLAVLLHRLRVLVGRQLEADDHDADREQT